ncbi:MAG: hypothetical protein Q9187_003920 [Circinaria calcarea]
MSETLVGPENSHGDCVVETGIEATDRKEAGLRQTLSGLQIFLIVISALIGTGIYVGDGQALRAAGPGGLLTALTIVGLIAIAMMEGLSEMIQMFAAPNALVEYVKNFVDQDLAIVMGVLYWYTYASSYQIAAATGANFLNEFLMRQGSMSQEHQSLQIGVFYILWPLLVIVINLFPVNGKTLMRQEVLVPTTIPLRYDGLKSTLDIAAGYQSDSSQTNNWAASLCLVVAFVAYSYLGVEVVGVTAFEARDLKDLQRPSKTVAYVVLIMYFAYAWAEVASVSSTDDNLHRISDDIGQTLPNSNTTTSAILILVATKVGYQGMKSAFAIIVICSGFSASNIALLRFHREKLVGRYARYNRWDPKKTGASTLLFKFQPWVTSAGLVGCFLIIFVFSTTLWWKGNLSVKEVVAFYAVPILVPLLWGGLKLRRFISNGYATRATRGNEEGQYFWYVKLDEEYVQLQSVINGIEYLKNDQKEAGIEMSTRPRTVDVHSFAAPHEVGKP